MTTCHTDECCSDGRPLKFKEGKPDLRLVPPQLAADLARVYEYGLAKYEEGSWKKFSLGEARKLISPGMRHVDEYRDGRYVDPESKCFHLMQAIWNLFTVHYHEYAQNPAYREAYERYHQAAGNSCSDHGRHDHGLPRPASPVYPGTTELAGAYSALRDLQEAWLASGGLDGHGGCGGEAGKPSGHHCDCDCGEQR